MDMFTILQRVGAFYRGFGQTQAGDSVQSWGRGAIEPPTGHRDAAALRSESAQMLESDICRDLLPEQHCIA